MLCAAFELLLSGSSVFGSAEELRVNIKIPRTSGWSLDHRSHHVGMVELCPLRA
jgi:hypothetical protein